MLYLLVSTKIVLEGLGLRFDSFNTMIRSIVMAKLFGNARVGNGFEDTKKAC